MKKIPTWLEGVIVLVLLGVCLLLILGSTVPKKTKDAGKENGSETTEEENEKNKIFSYTGEITEIKDNLVVLKTKKGETIKVAVDENTLYSTMDIPKTVSEEKGKIAENLFKRKTITFSDLEIGKEAAAISKENIAGKNEFYAYRIELINFK